MSTTMERLTISLPPDIAKAIDDLKKTEFYNTPKSKAIHHLLRLGMEAEARQKEQAS